MKDGLKAMVGFEAREVLGRQRQQVLQERQFCVQAGEGEKEFTRNQMNSKVQSQVRSLRRTQQEERGVQQEQHSRKI